MKKPDQVFRELAALYDFYRELKRFKVPAAQGPKPEYPASAPGPVDSPRRVPP
jgi:hypothetical protein